MRCDACASENAAAVMPLRLVFASCGVCVLEKATYSSFCRLILSSRYSIAQIAGYISLFGLWCI